VVLGLSRTINGRQQRIVISGDADFLSNAELGRGNLQTCNFDFSTAIFGWFTYGQFPIDTSRPPSGDTRIALTDKGLSLVKIFLLGVLPGLLLIIGAILLIKRKRK
jgi:ABC-2 type transport system permease protein